MNYRKLVNHPFKNIFFISCLLLILFTLSCDESEPTAAVIPDLDYTIAIASEVEDCSIVGCIVDSDGDLALNEAYNANVIAPADHENASWYRMFFQIQLRDIEGEAVEGATLTINESKDGSTDIVTSNLETFEEATNSDGIIEGYWKDDGKTGDFTITIKYTDEYENQYSTTYPITIHPISDVVYSISANAAEPTLTILTNDIYTDTIYARVKNATNTYLENVDVSFELLVGSGGLSSSTATTSKPEDTSPSAFAFVLYSTEYGVNNDTISIRTSAVDAVGDLVFDDVSILLSSEIFPAEFDVDILLTNTRPDTLIISKSDNIADSTYVIEVDAIVKRNNGQAVENVPIQFENLAPVPGTLISGVTIDSDSTGISTALIAVGEDEINTKDSILLRSYIGHPEILDEILHDLITKIYIYTEDFYQLEAAKYIDVYHNTNQVVNDNTTITYQTELSAIVKNVNGAAMPNMDVQFSVITQDVGYLEHDIAATDSTGGAATTIFNMNPNAFNDIPIGQVVPVDFEISIAGSDHLIEGLSLGYTSTGSSEPAMNVAEFHFHPDFEGINHDLGNNTPISVIAKNHAGAGIANVTVQFALDEADTRDSNGSLLEQFVLTCCTTDSTSTDSSGDFGVATTTYQNVDGGSDYIIASITNSLGEVNWIDSIIIASNDVCPDCVEELKVLSSDDELPNPDTDSEQTNIYAFYTDSLGNPPNVQSQEYIFFTSGKNQGTDWVEVGSVSPEFSYFESGTVSDIDSEIFPNAPQDSNIVYAHSVFNMENASGFVKIVGTYTPDLVPMIDTLAININSTEASFVEIIPPYPSQIAVQGSPDQESTVLTAEIRDGNGNLVTNSYITRFTLGASAMLAGVHFNGEEGVTDTYTYSSNGVATVTLNSGATPVSVGMTVAVYELTEISSVDDLDELEIIAEANAVPVIVASGPPTSGIIGYSFLEAINIGGGLTELPVSIMLWDTWANPVADSIVVYFTLNPPTAATIIAEAKTGNIKPNGTPDDAWPGVAWTTIQYNASQLFNFPEILATTTGNICSDSLSSYDDCLEGGEEWLTQVPLTFSSLDNIVSYQNVCVDCNLTLVPLSDTQHDFQCSPGEFPINIRAQLLDFYGVPVEGAILEVIINGSQGGPVIEAFEYACYWDSNSNGQYDDGEEQNLTEEECDGVPTFTWGQIYAIEPPSTTILTDEFGLKYWRVTFTDAECIQTSQDPTAYTCSTPSIQANLVNPNGALSEELNITLNSTCFE